jgi:hypothetical protein
MSNILLHLRKGKVWEELFFFVITDQVNTSTSDHEKHGKVRHQKLATKKKKTCVCIKRVKSDSYLTYGQSCKTYMELYVDTPQKKPPINSFVLWKCNMGWEY